MNKWIECRVKGDSVYDGLFLAVLDVTLDDAIAFDRIRHDTIPIGQV